MRYTSKEATIKSGVRDLDYQTYEEVGLKIYEDSNGDEIIVINCDGEGVQANAKQLKAAVNFLVDDD